MKEAPALVELTVSAGASPCVTGNWDIKKYREVGKGQVRPEDRKGP